MNETVVVGPFQCNCRVLVCPETGEAALIDPGDEPNKILQRLEKLQLPSGLPLQVKYLFHTHGHLDHIGGTRTVRESLKGKHSPVIAIHRGDEELYQQLQMQGKFFGIDYESPLPVDHYLEDEEIIHVGKLKFSIVHTPGHSPGGVCFRLHESKAHGVRETVFSGDTLFKESVGRTDLWGGDQDLLFKSIRQRIFTLDDDTVVCPGHGPNTQIGHEKRQNPFVR